MSLGGRDANATPPARQAGLAGEDSDGWTDMVPDTEHDQGDAATPPFERQGPFQQQRQPASPPVVNQRPIMPGGAVLHMVGLMNMDLHLAGEIECTRC